MINRVRVINDNLITADLHLDNPYNQVQIVNIEGMGPVTASLNTTSKGHGVGSNFSSSSINTRNLVFDIQINVTGDAAQSIRRDIYAYFPVGELVKLYFYEQENPHYIEGYVESVVPKIFTQSPTLQVSVVCVDPYFKKYPIGNKFLLPNGGVPANVVYGGRVDTGMTFEFTIKEGVAKPSGTDGSLNIRQATQGRPVREFNINDVDLIDITGAPFSPGDKISVTTVAGAKRATLTRGTTTHNIMSSLQNYRGVYLNLAQWPIFEKRRNTTIAYKSTQYKTEDLTVYVRWEELVEGL